MLLGRQQQGQPADKTVVAAEPFHTNLRTQSKSARFWWC